MTILLLVLTAIIAYGFGNISGCMLLTRLVLKKHRNKYCAPECSPQDFYRDFGPVWTAALGLFEAVKTVLVVLIGGCLLGIRDQVTVGRLFAMFCLLMGQRYPLLFFFKGGKALFQAGVAIFVVDWRVGLCCWVAYVVVVIFTRYASLGGVVAAVAAPIFLWVFDFEGLACPLALLCALLIVLGYAENLLRLVRGTEPHCFDFGGKAKAAGAPEEQEEDEFDLDELDSGDY